MSLSEQQLVDCNNYCYGCNGGWPDKSYTYLHQHGGSISEYNYPYTGYQSNCKEKGKPIAATVRTSVALPSGSEGSLQNAVAYVGPVTVCIDVEGSFSSYNGGVYVSNYCSTYNLNHAVLVAGYGHENGYDYWLVKNSWGPYWGDNGYIKMARNRRNMCGIASEAVYPLV